MLSCKLLTFKLNFLSQNDILELIRKNNSLSDSFKHLVSINTENLVIALENPDFEKAVRSSQYHLADGIGIVLACRLLGQGRPPRTTGVDTMVMLINHAAQHSLRCLLIGGEAGLAEEVVNCYKQKFPRVNMNALHGIKDIQKPKRSEEKAIKDIVRLVKPHFVFVAFGSPAQEIWIERHKKLFKGSLVMGVGGAFAFLSKKTKRAPQFIRQIGFEWLFRLVQQPWRINRQFSRLPRFALLVLRKKLKQLMQ